MRRTLPADHVCGPWCRDDEHAVLFNVDSDDPERVVPWLTAYFRRAGWDMLDAMPAPEAPLDTDAGHTELVNPSGRSGFSPTPPDGLWVWLVRMRPLPGGGDR